MDKRGYLGNLVGGFVVLIVGVTLLPSIADEVNEQQGNTTGAASSILGLTTLFFALGIMAVGVAIAIMGLKKAGFIGEEPDEDDNEEDDEDDNEEDGVENKPLPQKKLRRTTPQLGVDSMEWNNKGGYENE